MEFMSKSVRNSHWIGMDLIYNKVIKIGFYIDFDLEN